MAFKAKRDGVCVKCQGKITGDVDYISWKRTKGGAASGEAWHYPTCSLAAANTPTIEGRQEVMKTLKETNTPVVIGEDPIVSALDALREALAKKESQPVIDLEMIKAHVHHSMQIPGEDLQRRIVDHVDKKLFEFRPALDKEGIIQVIGEEIEKRIIKTLVIEKDEKEYKKFDLSHEELPTLIKLIGTRNASGHRMNVYMHGPAGSGKTTAAKQAADALGLKFGYTSLNPMTPDSRALGFMHAGGSYVETEFFRCYTQGGVFCFDEIDNASAGFVATLNSALENGFGAFPHGIFARHSDFVCVTTANTIGRGGDIHYPERRALDSAFLERFVFFEWCYDNKLTRAVVNGILGDEALEHMNWVDKRAEEYKARFPELVISPRAYIQSAILKANGFNKKMIESAAISRGLKNA